ncbi:hypothetical protein [Staphylococcus aureus]|uniref:hypothetical protein n=1 Tax=Staphylococcus aureus TaxID=1280 RepID=UPI001BFCE024|nr:hypothetical protein [Staphylococcus aureus]
MITTLNNDLIKEGFVTQIDIDGIYIPDYDIDIITEDTSFVINSYDSDATIVYSTEEAITYIKDITYSQQLSEEMDKNHYDYERESARYFKIENERIKIIDGRFYLEDKNGEVTVYVNIPSIIGAIQSKLLGEN